MEKLRTTRKGFFAVDQNITNRIIVEDLSAQALAAYLILARHTSGRSSQPHQISTVGASGISKRVGISYRKSVKAIEDLENNGFITAFNDAQKDIPRKRKYRYKLNIGSAPDWVYLSHSLIDGVGAGAKDPPLSRIYNKMKINLGIATKQARLDAIQLLLFLYSNQSILDYAGINPNMFWCRWEATENSCLLGGLELFEIQRKGTYTVATKLVSELFGCDELKDRVHTRFWHAFHELKRLGFLYEVLVVWDENPHDSEDPEMLYTLYVFDRHATDPFLAHPINRARLQSLMDDGGIGRAELQEEYSCISQRDIFWYAGNGYPMSVFRLRFRADTEDNNLGFESEKERADQWHNLLKTAQ